MSKYRKFESSRFVLGLSPIMYGVTASRAKKKEGLNLAHKPGDLGAFARSSSIPFYYSVSINSYSCQSPRKELEHFFDRAENKQAHQPESEVVDLRRLARDWLLTLFL